jgi:hypothetical protein
VGNKLHVSVVTIIDSQKTFISLDYFKNRSDAAGVVKIKKPQSLTRIVKNGGIVELPDQ